MNESEEISSDEKDGLSLNASSLNNNTGSSVMIVKENSLSITVSSTDEADQLMNSVESSIDLDESVNDKNISYCEPLSQGDISDGGSTVSSNNDNVADDEQHNIDDEELDIDDDVPNNMIVDIELVDNRGKSASGETVIPTEIHNLYEELVVLNEFKLVENEDAFKCNFCLNVCEPKAGVILTECIHSICKECTTRIVKTTNDVEIKCPYRDAEYICEIIIQHHEIKEILTPKDFDIFIQRSISLATGEETLNNDNAINGGDGEASGRLYQMLVALNENNFVETQESFKCEVCYTECEPKAGVILTECIHSICKECITRIVETTDDVEIKCPFRDSEYACNTIIPHREIKEICGAVTFEKLLERSLSVACCIEEEKHVVDTALYEELMVLDEQLLVENQEAFKCEVCLNVCEPKAGVIIAEYLHAFCKECISTLVEMTTDVEIHCPYRDSEYSCEKLSCIVKSNRSSVRRFLTSF